MTEENISMAEPLPQSGITFINFEEPKTPKSSSIEEILSPTAPVEFDDDNRNVSETTENSIQKLPFEFNSPKKSTIGGRLKFVRHQSAPLHHRSPVKSREPLMNEQNLDDIRAEIRTYRMELYKYKTSYTRSPIKRVASSGFESPKSPFKHPTPVKSYPSFPAYERSSPTAKSIELPLPEKYQILLEQYKNLDFMVCHSHNTGGVSTFEKLQPIIQQKTRRNFTLSTLARIKTVCPNMYIFQYEKIQLPTLSPVKLNYELTITPNEFSIQPGVEINPSIIVERIDCFRRSLFQIVKAHHQNFITEKLQTTIDDENMVRWHPEFDLNNVPDIELGSLPIAPEDNFKKVIASPIEIRQYAEKSSSQRVKRALFSTFGNDDAIETISFPSPKKESLSTDGISPSLIDKIRLKETSKLLSFNSISQEQIILGRLEQTINIIQQFFIAERATTLEFDLVARQIRDCHSGPLTYVQACETLNFLNEHAANDGWISILTIRERKFMKLNQQKSINTIIEHIQRLLNK